MTLESAFTNVPPLAEASPDEIEQVLDTVAGLKIRFRLFSFHVVPANRMPIGSVLIPLLGFEEDHSGIQAHVASAELVLRYRTTRQDIGGWVARPDVGRAWRKACDDRDSLATPFPSG